MITLHNYLIEHEQTQIKVIRIYIAGREICVILNLRLFMPPYLKLIILADLAAALHRPNRFHYTVTDPVEIVM